MDDKSFIQLLIASALGLHVAATAAAPIVRVYKTANCECCAEWVKHLQANGFTVRTQEIESPAVLRDKFGMPEEFGSCHSAVVQGYAIEGHVPADEIKRLLREQPDAKGLAVPSATRGSVGFEASSSTGRDVFLVHGDGKHSTYRQPA